MLTKIASHRFFMVWNSLTNESIYATIVDSGEIPSLGSFLLDYLAKCSRLGIWPHPSVLESFHCRGKIEVIEEGVERRFHVMEEKVLEMVHEVKMLGFCNFEIDSGTVAAVVSAIKLSGKFTSFRMDHCVISASQLSKLISALLIAGVTSISLSNLVVKELSSPHPVLELFSDSKLTSVILNIGLEDHEGVEIFHKLKMNKNINHLNLDHNNLGLESMQAASACLRRNRTLVALSLSNNKIEDPGLSCLFTHLKPFALDTEETKIKKEFGVVNVNSSKQNICAGNGILKYLNVSHNKLTVSILAESFDVLNSIVEIAHLSLQGLDLKDEESHLKELHVKYPDILEYKLKLRPVFIKRNDSKICEYLNQVPNLSHH